MKKIIINNISMFSVDHKNKINFNPKPCYRIGKTGEKIDNLLVYFPINNLKNMKVVSAHIHVYVYSSKLSMGNVPIITPCQVKNPWHPNKEGVAQVYENDGSFNKVIYNKGFTNVNITNIVKNWVENDQHNYGILLTPYMGIHSTHINIKGNDKLKNYLSKVVINCVPEGEEDQYTDTVEEYTVENEEVEETLNSFFDDSPEEDELDNVDNLESHEIIKLDRGNCYSSVYDILNNKDTSFFLRNNTNNDLMIQLEVSPDGINFFNYIPVAYLKPNDMTAFSPRILSKASRIKVNIDEAIDGYVDVWYLARKN